MNYRGTLLSPKIQKINEKFNSCYCGTLFDYCHSCVSCLWYTHQTIKFTCECQRAFYVSYIDINKNGCLNNFKTKDSSCLEIYSSVDKIRLLNTICVCAKCKHKLYDMIESPNFEDNLSFEKKFLNVSLQMSPKITKREKETALNKIDVFLSKLHAICPEDIYNSIISNSPKPYPSSTRITKLNRPNMIYMGDDLKLPCYVTM